MQQAILCPCGTSQNYSQCCALIHQNPQQTPSAEKLMRSRFSAFVLEDVDFIIDTYHSSCQASLSAQEIAQATKAKWLKLEIVSTHQNSTQENSESYVEFKAWFNEDNQLQLLHEKSRFVKEEINGQLCWRYIDGEHIESTNTLEEKQQSTKINRNAPCPCNSGKKYKKCCL